MSTPPPPRGSAPGTPPPRKKKRVRPARKIVPRGRMGIQWIIGPLILAAVILVLGIVFLLTQG